MNEGWKFIKEADLKDGRAWEKVHLPHTWNVDDVLDDVPGYYRGTGLYKRTFTIDNHWKNKDISIFFEGANQETEVFVNGHPAGRHTGGYAGFSIAITPYLKWNEVNELLVKVDNSYNANIAPLSADFTFYGGIYRNVYLTAVNKIHFSTDNYSAKGVYITTPSVSDRKAEVGIKCLLTNESDKEEKLTVMSIITDQKGKIVGSKSSVVQAYAQSRKEIFQKIPSIRQPRLWSPEYPYLYKVATTIKNQKGVVLDKVVNPLGFRWFRFDTDSGFLFNGKPYKLIGASRHQDYKGLGNAVPDSLAIHDVVLLKKMGANFLRVAHYPQAPCILNACDSLGILASVEIPVVNEITESDTFNTNCDHMLLEMIHQNFNHPSVVLWCYMNEILLKTHFTEDKQRQQQYLAHVRSLAQHLENLTRKEDPFRYTMMADHGNFAQYRQAGLLEIPMVVGWNLYSGWYGGTMEDFPVFLDKFHKEYPSKPFMVTEYGADADPRIRSNSPVRFDKSVDFTTRFHQFYFIEMMKRPYVAGAVVWNLADFNSETRAETMPHMNNKGLLEWDRKPKDPYYFYQAVLSKTPFIKILGSCQNKSGIADSLSKFCYQTVQVASNLDSVTIQLNDSQQKKLKVIDGLCEWRFPFKEGKNRVIAEGKNGSQIICDTIEENLELQPVSLLDKLGSFHQINILLGSTRYYTDEKGQWWQPDQLYQKGRWGSVGGTRFKIKNNGRLPYGTDRNILGTYDDPIYQTQLTGIKQYRFDIAPGSYELTFHFAELEDDTVTIPPNDLNGIERKEQPSGRVFNVEVNGQTFLNHFNLEADYGISKAVVKSIKVIVKNEEGIKVDFVPIEGLPVLNALQLKKL